MEYTTSAEPTIKPLPHAHRNKLFWFLLGLFILVIPFLYLYATGYRFNLDEEAPIVSTGGLYIAADDTEASIYIDDELVRETRTFRQAFYAQGITPGTHRVHVQKEDHHTWVKELPVYEHLVTEAQAFNLPIVPSVRVISPWLDERGTTVLFASTTREASTTNPIVIASTSPHRSATSTATSSLIANTEYISLVQLFSTTTATTSVPISQRLAEQFGSLFVATTTPIATTTQATTTVTSRNVRLYEAHDGLYATWTGAREDMPYYYCAEDFDLLSTSTAPDLAAQAHTAKQPELIGPVQEVAQDTACDPTIRIDTKGEEVRSFDFFPGSSDFVLVALDSGIYMVEVDDRAWQNMQPIMQGTGLDMRVENGNIYVYDGHLIYHVLLEE